LSKRKILFLNPPSLDGRLINRHILDPHASKGAYLYPPYDFLLLSGWFHPHPRWELSILDAMALKLNENETLGFIKEWKPDFILALTAPQSHIMDIAFLKRVKQEAGCPLFSAGAVQHSRGKPFLEQHEWMDGLLLEPVNNDLLHYVEGGDGPFTQLVLRNENHTHTSASGADFDIPLPRHDLIDARLYSYPAMKTDRFTSILASYSCPYTCEYCEAPDFKYRMRPTEAVMEELRFVKSLGIHEVCFKDWTFGANSQQAESILDEMIQENLGMNWFTFTRAEILNRNLVQKMKRAGCGVLQIGVETVQTEVLKKLRRDVDMELIRKTFKLCRDEKVSTLATLVLGLPGCNEESILKTIDFILEVDPDYASFNIITPLLGSNLREQWEAQGFIDPNIYENQDSTHANISHLDISPERLQYFRDMAVRRFYFRTRYIIRRLTQGMTFSQLLNEAKTGWELFRRHVL